jgi:hypothetical protein
VWLPPYCGGAGDERWELESLVPKTCEGMSDILSDIFLDIAVFLPSRLLSGVVASERPTVE